jgi:undecaprenyl-diphosphatase
MRKKVGALVVLLACAALFAIRFARAGGPMPGDEAVLGFFHRIVFEPLTTLVKVTTWAGSVVFVGPASIVLARRIIRSSRADAFLLTVASIGASFVHLFLKIKLPRARPKLFDALVRAPGEGTFPSGHAVNITAFTVAVAFVAARTWPDKTTKIAVISALVIAWICATRLYLQVHWPSDMLSGVVIGAAWALLLEVVLHRRREVH